MYGVIMDFALNLTIKKAGCEGTRKHFEAIGDFFFHIDENCVNVSELLWNHRLHCCLPHDDQHSMKVTAML